MVKLWSLFDEQEQELNSEMIIDFINREKMTGYGVLSVE